DERTPDPRREGEPPRFVVDRADGRDPARAADAVARSALLERDHDEAGLGPVEERVVVGLGLRPARPERLAVQPRRLPEVRDVEERQLRALWSAFLVHVLADAEQ